MVPCYNAAPYLTACLDALISQTLREIEILCVNDGSTDNSRAILDEYCAKDDRIRVFNQSNAGPGAARNTALDHVRGEYILFCDADDTMACEAAAECYDVMNRENSDFMIFNTNIVEVNREETAKKNSAGEYIQLVTPQNIGRHNRLECVKISLLGNLWGYAFRAALIRRHNLRFTHYLTGEDGIFLLSYLLTIDSGYALNRVYYNYYARKASLADTETAHPWIKRIFGLPRLMYHTSKFAVKNGILLREILVFQWLFAWLKSRR